jgi:integrase
MRHTAITKLVEAGVPLPTVQKIGGHKTLAMVSRHTHLSDRHVDSAMEALERALHPFLTNR